MLQVRSQLACSEQASRGPPHVSNRLHIRLTFDQKITADAFQNNKLVQKIAVEGYGLTEANSCSCRGMERDANVISSMN